MKKKVVIAVLLSFLGMLIFSMCHASKVKQENQKTLNRTSSSKSYDNSESSVVDKAKATLETPGTKIDDEDAKQIISEVMIYLASVDNVSDVELTYNNYLSISSKVDAQTIISMLKVGYVYDQTTLQIYNSESDNVLQFIATLKKGDEVLSFTGNYVTNTKQIELAGLQGEPTGIANE